MSGSKPQQIPTLAPFLKWAGGKRWFADRCLHLTPQTYNRYIEPFLGSGAMFFALRPAEAVLSDLNPDLINCYRAVCDTPEDIIERLTEYHRLHDKAYYYDTRAVKPNDPVERAAWFIYLNRTCWNGLYRVNRKNEFNVPIGTKTSVLLPNDDFVGTSRLLSGVEILQQDFEVTLNKAEDGDFVFVDPPYTVKHNLNGFVKYNDKIFSWSDQLRLRDAVVRAAARGARVLVTNANHSSIREIYDGVGRQQVVGRASVLAASKAHRSQTEELVIQTWLDAHIDNATVSCRSAPEASNYQTLSRPLISEKIVN
ncbi:Dam family site-specific DNA-(adenine-N6)-methyltransferase [Acetobacter fabarum]|uniref:DNA adenine methylase n=1 Tax=Acetobacter fabarum TaxID=483199 RepID=UPI0014046194|nr:Dam family site-specific DNA-(adenine-N6)-methyltransferase [Acetobacter fabarum]NHO42503.1 Dam family site-specific DNA-(adenine-N6)-methyltransferase [Acetobacter fabarum]GBQ38707.1 DNA adenine methylase [Acetobacter fabarum DSM 19596]